VCAINGHSIVQSVSEYTVLVLVSGAMGERLSWSFVGGVLQGLGVGL